MMKRLFLAALLLLTSPAFTAEEPDHAIHEELRALLRGIEQAVNSEEYQDLAQYFSENMRFAFPGNIKPLIQENCFAVYSSNVLMI